MRGDIAVEFMRVLKVHGTTCIGGVSRLTAISLGMTPREAALPYQGENRSESRTEWQYQNAWVATILKPAGLVTTMSKGAYTFTDDGDSVFDATGRPDVRYIWSKIGI